MSTIKLGIDPGVNTGVAKSENKVLTLVTSMDALTAMDFVKAEKESAVANGNKLKVVLEDARLRKWYGPDAAVKKQGAGSIKRDCSMWEDFLKRNDIDYVLVHPMKGYTKRSAADFKKTTKWEGRTNEHGRDAAFLIWGL